MCGVCGVMLVGDAHSMGLDGRIRAMVDTLRHRGPDESGVWTSSRHPVALGHSRLAVVDLSLTGHQPMAGDNGRWQISYNGEIYNHDVLRGELLRAGMHLQGTSDTEVLAAGISSWGLAETLERIDGMFAFAAWDAQDAVLHLVRDRMGEKPLYYGWSGSTLVYGSELRALRAWPTFTGEIDRESLALMLQTGYVPGPRSIYRDTYKLQPGQVVSVPFGATQGSERHWSYWDVHAIAVGRSNRRTRRSQAELVDSCEELLSDSVTRQMVADVPVGALLSGGIDSSLIVALAQRVSTAPVKTFTVGFTEPDYDESTHARAVAAHLGTDHTEVFVTPQDAHDVIPTLPAIYDEPFGDSSQIPTVLISRIARKDVTVALTGDGGDELFGGYQRYAVHGAVARGGRIPLPIRRGAASVIQSIPDPMWRALGDATATVRLPGLGRRLPERMRKGAMLLATPNIGQISYAALMTHGLMDGDTLVPGAAARTPFMEPTLWDRRLDRLGRMRLIDQLIYLPDDLLVKVDRAAMSASLETRAPLLSRGVVEFAWSLPSAQLRHRGKGKWLLRQVLKRHLPAHMFERPKMGFGVPVDAWLRGPLNDWAAGLIHSISQDTSGLLDVAMIERLWRAHMGGQENHASRLWNILMFQGWRETYP